MTTKVSSPKSHSARNEWLKKLVELLQYKKIYKTWSALEREPQHELVTLTSSIEIQKISHLKIMTQSI